MTHPITPPPELVQQWWEEADQYQRSGDNAKTYFDHIATRAAQWGADQELEESVGWLIANQNPRWADALRAARRPQPPSLKEQALARLASLEKLAESMGHDPDDTIRRALEALPDD